MADVTEALTQAVGRHQGGDLDGAERAYRAILDEDPDHADALHLLGLVLFQKGDPPRAAELIRQAISLAPGLPMYHGNLGRVLMAQGDASGAVDAYRDAVALTPDDAALHSDMAAALVTAGDIDAARSRARLALELNPNLAPAHLNLGLALQGMGGTSAKEAEASFRRAAELDPGLADAHHALGQIHQARGEDDAAMECYRLAVAARPDLIEAKCNLGNILRERLDLDAAMAQYDAALATAPGVAALHANRGVALHELGRFEEALAAYDAALAIEPDDAECRRNRGMTRLLLGRFEAGWADYEARWQTRRFKDEGRGRDPRKPRWAVDAVKDGTTVLVQAEQGIGDTIQFARYIPRIAALGFHVTLQCPGPLMRLLASLEGVTKIVEQGGPAPDHDFHIPMLSLPAAFSTRLESVPADIPYLKPEKDETAAWRDELSDVAGPRIGIAWKGSAAHPRDRVRSPGLAPLLPLLALPGASFLSLQKDGGAADLAAHGLDAVIDPTVALRDFAATAALVANLDLVVTCDTAVGHLAGALGRPVVMLLPHVPEWRWLLERGDTPWYPTMRLIRQPAPGDWAGAVRSAADHIRRHWL